MAFQAVLTRQLALLAEQLTAAASAEVEPLTTQVAELAAARERLRARAEELTAANNALSIELDARAADRASAVETAAALEAERARAADLAAQLAAIEARHADLQREHAQLAETVKNLRSSTEAHGNDLAAAQAAVTDAAAARDVEAAAREAAEADAGHLRAQLATSRAELEAEATRLRSESSDLRATWENEATLLREELATARAAHRERLVARLGLIFEEIGRGISIDDVLSAAANGLAGDFARVAVFAASGGRLEARYQRGFDQASGIERAVPVVGDASLLGRAGAIDELGLHATDALTDLPFAGAPSLVVTAPITVRGELLALIYADNDGQTPPSDGGATPARVADIVRRHTALRLDRLTLELKTIGELRAYAKMLLDEVEYVYRADVSARKPDSERLERLTENLRCARQIYQQRVTVEGPAMAELLEEVVTATITAKMATPFGRELAGVAPHAHPAMSEVSG
jgi:hypothetical protein